MLWHQKMIMIPKLEATALATYKSGNDEVNHCAKARFYQ
uniref:Uncharacterized protein n=1 Tax=Rhizophora mucronata TaxID=61149 RepID=A0A2P2IIX9_RHIMU